MGEVAQSSENAAIAKKFVFRESPMFFRFLAPGSGEKYCNCNNAVTILQLQSCRDRGSRDFGTPAMTAVTIHIRRYPNRRLYDQRLAPALVVLIFHHAGVCSRDIMKPCAKHGRMMQPL